MDKFYTHFMRETKLQTEAKDKEIKRLKTSVKYLWINIFIYLLITCVEYFLSTIGHSQSLRADAFNNLSGVISTALLIFGIYEATNVNDDDFVGIPVPKYLRGKTAIQLSRFRLETVFTLVTSFVIILISGQIIFQGITSLFKTKVVVQPNIYSILGAAFASLMMVVVWLINKEFGKKLQNSSLLAASKDSLGDLVTSVGTLLTLIGTIFLRIKWLDDTVSIAIGFFILWSGIQIFQESTMSLTDYFDPKLEDKMLQFVSKITGVRKVLQVNGRQNGNIMVVDLTIMVDPKITAVDIYQIDENIEEQLRNEFNVFDVQIEVVPDPSEVKDIHIKI
ncbi:cation diffusion facilitator family transporter [Companilactobacillus sp. HBUAS59699]|uniref:cation diffusion facilitator family transporter n=1 Tax=Companilactobacillus sp. HBUAS59699 TaxID=3109358 RepID=UPI002FF416CD